MPFRTAPLSMPGFSTSARPSRLARLAALALIVAVLPACSDDPAGPELESNTIFGLVTDADELTRLETLVRETELSSLFQNRSDLTLFAPTDLALERLGPDLLNRLRGNEDILLKVLRRHIVPARVRVADLRDGETLTPLEGPPLEVRVEGDRVTVGGASLTVRRSDFETGNGVVHYLDDVVRDHLTLAERLRITPLTGDFASVFAQAELDELLEHGEPYTLLIPIDNAFDAFGGDHLQELMRFANRDVLLKVLRHHILPGRVRAETLGDGDALTPLDGSPLAIENEGGIIHLGGARVIAAEIETSDGLIYLLDRIVLNHLDLAERIQIDPDLKTFHAILDRSGVLDQLRGPEPYTVFLPTDASLEFLGDGFVPALEARPDLLLRTAQYAVVPGRVLREDLLEAQSLTTLGGYTLPVIAGSDVTGVQVFVGQRGRVDFPPLEAGNSLLYTISPFVYPPNLDLEERAVFSGVYRFLNLMEQAGLMPLLQGDEQYTIFPPLDQALTGVSIPDSQLPNFLRAYLAEGRYELEGSGFSVESLAGTPIEVRSSPQGIFANDRPVRDYASQITNGVLYSVEGLFP